MKRRLLSFLGWLLAVSVCFAGCGGSGGQTTSTDGVFADETAGNGAQTGLVTDPDGAVPVSDAYQQTEDLYILDVFPYSGGYVEDGSDDPCEDVCAVLLENRSETHYRYLHFTLTTSEDTYTFTATTLFAGARMTVLCEEKTAYSGGDLLAVDFLSVVPFDEPPTVHTDTLRITYTDGFINVKNLTDAALADVYVYYKDTDEAGYLGGITYRAAFGEIAPGETVQKSARNMLQETCRVVFATYEP